MLWLCVCTVLVLLGSGTGKTDSTIATTLSTNNPTTDMGTDPTENMTNLTANTTVVSTTVVSTTEVSTTEVSTTEISTELSPDSNETTEVSTTGSGGGTIFFNITEISTMETTSEAGTTPSPTTTTSITTTTTPSPPTTTSPTTTSPTTASPTTAIAPSTDDPITTSRTAPTTASPTTPTSPPSTAAAAAAAPIAVVVGVVVGMVVAILVLIIGVACAWFFCCGGKRTVRKRSYPSRKLLEMALEELENGSTGMTVEANTTLLYAHIDPQQLVRVAPSNLSSHVAKLHEDDGFEAEEEYDAAKDLDPVSSTSYATQPYNEAKNRYINILASDHTRVMLRPLSKERGSDYINANFIDGYNSNREYIAAQGPLPNTVIDFWRMIWEQDTSIVVMVTNPTENGVIKCEEYWPSKGCMQFGGFTVLMDAEQLYPEFMLRRFHLRKISKAKSGEDNLRVVTQLHFTCWPDFGVPENASSMLKFVRYVRRQVTPSQGPMVVHCSAGVGRTGTFIALDILLQRMHEEDCMINVQEVVCRMRAQRGNMVQTNAQYLFIYDALLHAYTHGVTEVTASQLKNHMASLTTPTSAESGQSQLDKEYKFVETLQLEGEHLFSVAMDTDNLGKSRNQNCLPLDQHRVVLEELDGREDSDYINASYVDGYYGRVEFVMTQHPLPNTKADFWRMMIERCASVLVVFGPLKKEEDRYWPTGEEKLELSDGITVRVEKVEEEDGMTTSLGAIGTESNLNKTQASGASNASGEQKPSEAKEKEEKKAVEGIEQAGDQEKKEESGGQKEGSEEQKSEESKGAEAVSGNSTEAKNEGEGTKETVQQKENIVIRNFNVEMDNVVQPVRMFHMQGWPSEGAPDSTEGIMSLIQQSRQLWRETGFNPIVIHTATGVSQEASAVYCALCILMRQLEVESFADVVSTMEKLRQKCPGLLPSKMCYRYIYAVLAASVK